MKKNLSKPRFILMLCVAAFLALILVVQFVVLSVYRSRIIEMQERIDDLDRQIEEKEQTPNSVFCQSKNSYELLFYEE